jgi:catecholate siderophore receptor
MSRRSVRARPKDNVAHTAYVLADTPGAGLLATTVAMLLHPSAARAADVPAPPSGSPSIESSLLADNLEEVLVKGYKVESLSLSKYPDPLLTTPQTAEVVTTQLMEDQGVSSLRDSLRNVSGISIGAGEGSYQGDNFSIRGFAARSDMYLDGMSDWGNYNRDPFNIEEVEVLKGPSSAEFGRGSVGGVVNTESKTPQLTAFTVLDGQVGTDQTRRATVDFDAPITQLPGAAFRLNLMVHKNTIEDRGGPYYSRWGLAPTFAIGLETPTRLTLSYFLQHQNDLPDYGIPWINDRPAPVPRNAYYGFTDGGNYFDAKVQLATVKFEHDFNESITVREQFRFSSYHRALQISQADPPDQFQNNGNGDIPAGTPLSSVLVDRTQIDGVSRDQSADESLDLFQRFETGALRHTFNLGAEFLRQSVDTHRIEPCWVGVTATPLLAPTPGDPFTGQSEIPGQTCTNVNADVETTTAYAIDTVKLGQQWSFSGAVRVDHITSDYLENSPATILDFEPGPLVLNFPTVNTLPSFRAGIVFQPVPTGSVYLSGGTSIHPNVAQLAISSETPLVPPPNFNLEPIGRSVEVEVGTKWQLANQRLSVNAAIFWDQLKNPSGVDVDDPLNYVTGGKERVEGVELGLAGHVTDAWQLLLNYTYQDGIVTGSSDPTLIGEPVLNSPKNSASLWTTYDLTRQLQIGAGANEVSSRTGWEQPDPLNGRLLEAPGYVIGSAMLKYRITEQFSLQANVTNLTNKYYYDGVHPGHVVPGPGRVAYLGLHYGFQ